MNIKDMKFWAIILTFLMLLVGAIFLVIRYSEKVLEEVVDNNNSSYEQYEEIMVTTEEASYVEVEESVSEIEVWTLRREALDDDIPESVNNDNTNLAEFDYSGMEYWQINALNTLAKTISNCEDNEDVKIVYVNADGEVGIIRVTKEGKEYEAQFNTKSYAIIDE